MKRLSAKLLALGLVVCSVSSSAYAASPVVMVQESVAEIDTAVAAEERVNLASGKAITTSAASSRGRQDDATDGDTTNHNYTDAGEGPQWTQVDLGAVCNVDEITLYRHRDGRQYKDTIVLLSADPEFAAENTLVVWNANSSADTQWPAGTETRTFPAGEEALYVEEETGKSMSISDARVKWLDSAKEEAEPWEGTSFEAQYVRVYMNGSQLANGGTHQGSHVVELQVWGTEIAEEVINTETAAPEAVEEDNDGNYWSTSNAPLIYGPSSITIPVGTAFDVKDTRFRVFAKDFEDREISQNISVSGSVDSQTAGTYTLTYTVADSHGNQTTKQVPITVVEDSTADIIVERTMYTTPSVWNMDLAGFSRNNYGDSQHLGIYMPADSSIEMRIVEGSKNLKVNLYANDSKQESSVSVPLGENWTTISNVRNGVSYHSVPLVSTPVMERGADINTTFTIAIKYGSDVQELNYYLQGDNEDEFRAEWNEEQNAFGVIENEVLTAVLPYADLAKTTNHFSKGFSSLENFGNYWINAVKRMDEMVGLEFNPEDPVIRAGGTDGGLRQGSAQQAAG